MRVFGMRSVRRVIALAATASLIAGIMATPAVMAAGVTSSTTTLGAPTLNPKPVGETSTVTATVTTGATGDVMFWDNAALVATVALDGAGEASWTLPAEAALGTHEIRAQYQGDATYDVSEDTRSLTVGPRDVTVTLTLSGPRDGSGATAQKGDVLTAMVDVDDAGATGSLAISGGTVQITVDGALKATITLPEVSTTLNTGGWALGDRSVVATYQPGSATDHASGSSPASHVMLAANVVQATGLTPTPATFYPYKDGYKDTSRIRGTRAETASVTIRIYSSTNRLVRTLTAPSGTGAWGVLWNGRNTAGSYVAAGKYKVRQTVKDALGATKLLPTTYVTVSAKRIYTRTVTIKKSLSQRSAGSPSAGWVGWTLTLPSATVYKKLVFGVYGRSVGSPASVFGPRNYNLCSVTGTQYCFQPYANIRSTTGWSNVTGNLTANRHGRTTKLYVVAQNSHTFVSYARVVVTYGVLR